MAYLVKLRPLSWSVLPYSCCIHLSNAKWKIPDFCPSLPQLEGILLLWCVSHQIWSPMVFIDSLFPFVIVQILSFSLIVILPPWGLPTGVFLEINHTPSWCWLRYAKQAFCISPGMVAASSMDCPSNPALYLVQFQLIFNHSWLHCIACSRWGFIPV